MIIFFQRVKEQEVKWVTPQVPYVPEEEIFVPYWLHQWVTISSVFILQSQSLYRAHMHSPTCSNNFNHAKEEMISIATLTLNPAI